MSIMQDYEIYRNDVGEKEWRLTEMFLEAYPEYFLSDLLYNREIYGIYEEWKNRL